MSHTLFCFGFVWLFNVSIRSGNDDLRYFFPGFSLAAEEGVLAE